MSEQNEPKTENELEWMSATTPGVDLTPVLQEVQATGKQRRDEEERVLALIVKWETNGSRAMKRCAEELRQTLKLD